MTSDVEESRRFNKWLLEADQHPDPGFYESEREAANEAIDRPDALAVRELGTTLAIHHVVWNRKAQRRHRLLAHRHE